MKVLFINSVCGVGSTGRICTSIAEKLIGNGYDCKIAYGRSNAPEKYKNISYKICSEFNVRCNALKTRLFDNEGFNARHTTKKFIKWIKEYNPDVIHLHNLHGYYINVKILFDYLKNDFQGKVVWTLHDCWSFTGRCPHFDFEKCYKWKTGCYNCPRLKEYPMAFFDNSKKMYGLKKSSFMGVKNMTLVTPSQWLADLVKQSFLKEYPVKVINNGIDLSIFKPTESNFREKNNLDSKFIVLGVANIWNNKKGLDVFVKLTNQLDDRFQIVLIGTNDKIDKKLSKNIISIHRTNNQVELAEIYSTANVFANPTREENYPTVNLEAIACGTPVVTFRTGGSPECISDKTGIVVEKDDFEAFKLAIENVCINKPFSKEDYLERAKSFDKNDKFKEYIELYK